MTILNNINCYLFYSNAINNKYDYIYVLKCLYNYSYNDNANTDYFDCY